MSVLQEISNRRLGDLLFELNKIENVTAYGNNDYAIVKDTTYGSQRIAEITTDPTGFLVIAKRYQETPIGLCVAEIRAERQTGFLLNTSVVVLQPQKKL